MIVGDPEKFAIMVDVVDEWNSDDSFNNGIIVFWINSNAFPHKLVSVTLNSDFRRFYEAIQNIVKDIDIFNMDTVDAFKAIYKLVYPEDRNVDNDYRYQISPQGFNDHNHLIFAVSDGKEIRILASSLVYDIEESTCILENIEVIESFIIVEEFNKMISNFENNDMKKFL